MSVERGDLRTETGSEITAAQDQTLQTKYHLKNITNRYRLQIKTMSTIARDNRPHHISTPNIGERTMHKETLLYARKW